MLRIWSESTTVCPSNSIDLGLAGRVPTAMTNLSAVRFCWWPCSFSTSTVLASRNLAVPEIRATLLRDS